LIAQVVKRSERRRVVETERRMVDGTPARVETLRRRSQGDGVINTADIERLHATFRARLASLTRRGRALTRRTLTLQHGM
jgi:IS1 family transposase